MEFGAEIFLSQLCKAVLAASVVAAVGLMKTPTSQHCHWESVTIAVVVASTIAPPPTAAAVNVDSDTDLH